MPLITSSSYHAPLLLKKGHACTIYAALYRSAPKLFPERQTINTPDGDFMDVDVNAAEAEDRKPVTVILLHGLEGSSDAHYMRAMASICLAQGWNTIRVNFRGCSGRPNHTERSYHSGASDDLDVVVQWAETKYPNEHFVLIGFSLGGNVCLKYLGEGGRRASVVGGVAVSVPCDLNGSSKVLAKWINRIYMRRFMKDLVKKLELKNQNLGTDFDISTFRKMKTFAEFDGAYTAPVHGFASAEDYWTRSSSLQFLDQIDVPTLLINAKDDPFLSKRCFPETIARNSDFFYLETPGDGGHVGFLTSVLQRSYSWQESRAVEFLREQVVRKL